MVAGQTAGMVISTAVHTQVGITQEQLSIGQWRDRPLYVLVIGRPFDRDDRIDLDSRTNTRHPRYATVKGELVIAGRPGNHVPAVQIDCILPGDPGDRHAGNIKSQDQGRHVLIPVYKR